MKEYLVTAQGYSKTDEYKQTILLHESFLANNAEDAESMFNTKFTDDFNIMNIYSVVDLTDNEYGY